MSALSRMVKIAPRRGYVQVLAQHACHRTGARRLAEELTMWPDEVVMKNRSITAAKFKSQCLSLLDEVARSGTELVVTKRGTPIARVVPLARPALRGKLKIHILGDIVGPSEPEWTG